MVIGIVGLGLIGGSVAKAYQKDDHFKVYGKDKDSHIESFAEIYGAIDDKLTDDKIGECDCILLAIYPEAAIAELERIAPLISKDALVMDLCGTKKSICKAGFALADKYGFTFVGGHPMAGTQYAGFSSSDPDLFRGQPMVFVPPVYDDILLYERVKNTLAPLNFGSFSVTTAEDHDAVIAFTSQLAHVVSNAYIKSPTAKAHKGFSAGSYKDLTRVAWLNPEMWTQLFMENKDNLVKEIDFIIESLNQYRDAMQVGDADKLHDLLDEGKRTKEEVDG